jgi:hypothetical protein
MPLDDDIAHYLTAPDARALVVKLANERKTTNQLVAQLRAENAELKAITNQPPPDPARQFIATFDQLGELRSEAGEGMSNDGVWWVQRNAPGRITVVPGAGAGLNALRLHTEPGDNNIAGSNLAERADVAHTPRVSRTWSTGVSTARSSGGRTRSCSPMTS